MLNVSFEVRCAEVVQSNGNTVWTWQLVLGIALLDSQHLKRTINDLGDMPSGRPLDVVLHYLCLLRWEVLNLRGHK